ncbi:MAG: hypothetical protein U1C74_27620 [Phenylobacterium sp.]|nr:hypothetical protein [Phenylobacterium sp.]
MKAQRAARDRLIRQERQAKAKVEANEVVAGVAETVALSRARGAAVVTPGDTPRSAAHRRLTGLESLAARGRLTPEAMSAGLRYGQAYQRVKHEARLPSSLAPRLGGPASGPDPANVLTQAERTAAAAQRLTRWRETLARHPDLVTACDLICGEEMTPREAAGADREAVRLETLVRVALDLLAAES